MSNIDHVVDYIDLFAASLQLRIESDPVRAEELAARIAASRAKLDLAREGGDSPAAAVIARLALSETEQLVVWLLIALALRRELRAMRAAATSENGSDPTLEAIRLDKVRSDGYAFQIEMTFKCWKKGFRIREIPIMFVDRQAGVSKMSKKIVWEAVGMVWRLTFLDLIGRLE